MALFGPSSYTVHVPSSGRDDAVLVPDRFSLLAFLLPPVYFLMQRRWLLALAALAVMLVFNTLFVGFGLQGPAITLMNLLIGFFVALEAPSLTRWGLSRSGYREDAVVVAQNQAEAERRYFEESAASQPPAALKTAEKSREPMPVIGLFPTAEPKVLR